MIDMLIDFHRKKLESMILQNEDYKKILKQSERLDLYITIKMNEINVKES